MRDGWVQQVGDPMELYNEPANRFVAGFIGSPAMNFAPAMLEGNGASLRIRLSDNLAFDVPESRAARYRPHVGKEVTFGLRPEHITETRGRENGVGQEFPVTLDVVEPMGMETMVYFRVNGTEICGRVEPTAAKNSGETMQLRANLDHMHLIDTTTGTVL
jgi:multiple sugar transport system ATP-binding protein